MDSSPARSYVRKPTSAYGGQVVSLSVIRLSPTYDEQSAQYAKKFLKKGHKTKIKKKQTQDEGFKGGKLQ